MPWQARLHLDYTLQDTGKTVLHHRHEGPLRLFHSLYPEGPAICHNVIIHPPGGLVEGDTLTIDVQVGPGAHGLLSTPGATRFYRSTGEAATQRVTLRLDEGARLEWVPLETIAYPGCQGLNALDAHLGEGAELLAWDVTALGLPASGQAFDRGCLRQHLQIHPHWLEQGRLDASDDRLMTSATGLAGHRCMGTLVLASGSAWPRTHRETLLDAVRAVLPDNLDPLPAGATCLNERLIVLRVLGPVVEPVMALMQQAWAALRSAAWGLPDRPPRIWSV